MAFTFEYYSLNEVGRGSGVCLSSEQLMANCHFNCLCCARNVVLKHRNWEKLTKLLLYTSKEVTENLVK